MVLFVNVHVICGLDKSETEVEDEMERLVRNICTNLISFARVLVDNPKGLFCCFLLFFHESFLPFESQPNC